MKVINRNGEEEDVKFDKITSRIKRLNSEDSVVDPTSISQKVINNYDTTIYVEEALHRLVELHYKIGIIDEAEKYANLLGYNYQSSEWYESTYKILNKNYKKNYAINSSQDKKETLLKKFRKLFN